MEIPLFPLHAVLCPGVVLPLHIFEPRYRAMIARCLRDASPFGVVCISAGSEVGASRVEFASVGTLAEIREARRHPDGRLHILTIGTRRFRVSTAGTGAADYLVGTAELLDEPLGDEVVARRLARRASDRFIQYLELLQQDDESFPGEAEVGDPGPAGPADPDAGEGLDAAGPLTWRSAGPGEPSPDITTPDDPTALAHVLAGLLRIELARRQRLLEASTTEERLRDLNRVLGGEIALLERQLSAYVPDGDDLAARRN